MNRYILELERITNSAVAGAKAFNLHLLQRWGFLVPKTVVCPIKTMEDFNFNRELVLNQVGEGLKKFVNPGQQYAVRSSSDVEDDNKYSYAGQFKTYLNVGSQADVIDAVCKIWESHDPHILAYTKRVGATEKELKTGVIIQEMVKAKIAGVVFTRNPLTGFNETIVEMVEGSGTALAQQGLTPGRFIFKSGNCTEAPSSYLSYLDIIRSIAETAGTIGKKYRKGVDLEWAWDGDNVYWLQLRQITGLNNISVYSNTMSKEMLPGMIKPLVWSINIPVVNSSWKKILQEMVGQAANGIDIYSLAKPIYYRAYFNMGVIGSVFELLGMPSDSLETMMGVNTNPNSPKFRMKPGIKTMKYLPRMTGFIIDKMRFQPKIEGYFNNNLKIITKLAETDVGVMDITATLDSIRELILINRATSYYTVLSQIIAAANTGLLRRYMKKKAPDLKVVIAPDRGVIQEIDVTGKIEQLHQAWMGLSNSTRNRIMTKDILLPDAQTGTFQHQMDIFIRLFGHYSEHANDLSNRTWRENPELILNMITHFQPIPRYDSQQVITTIRKLALKPWEKHVLCALYRQTIKSLNNRERITYLYSFGYGLFRPRFIHLAKLLKKQGLFNQENDIFYFTFNEIEEIIKNLCLPPEYQTRCDQRKTEMAEYQNVILPDLVIGETPPPIIPKSLAHGIIRGTPVSGGYVQGPIRIVRNSDDFNKVIDGDILLVPFSDISWTPLFSRAKAIISESGGFLSHCAIVAREFGIPAVVAVTECSEIRDGDIVSVNGFTGEIIDLTASDKLRLS